MVVSLHPVPAEFASAVESIRAQAFRSELRVQEIRAPEGLAPHAHALSADVRGPGEGDDDASAAGEPLFGTGRFIVLQDSSEPEAWRGSFRVVCFVQAPLETDIGGDELLSDVAWSWLIGALDDLGAAYDHPSGTVTVINSTGYGELAPQGEGSQIEMRASWTPHSDDLGPHVAAWSALLCQLAGLPPVDTQEVPLLKRVREQNGRH